MKSHQLLAASPWELRSKKIEDQLYATAKCQASDKSDSAHPGISGSFLKWWYPTTIGFPTKNDHFGVF